MLDKIKLPNLFERISLAKSKQESVTPQLVPSHIAHHSELKEHFWFGFLRGLYFELTWKLSSSSWTTKCSQSQNNLINVKKRTVPSLKCFMKSQIPLILLFSQVVTRRVPIFKRWMLYQQSKVTLVKKTAMNLSIKAIKSNQQQFYSNALFALHSSDCKIKQDEVTTVLPFSFIHEL